MSHIAVSPTRSLTEKLGRSADEDTPKSAKLSPAQIKILKIASERDDRLIASGDDLASTTRRTILGLLQRGLLVEVSAQAQQPVWRQDKQGHKLSAAITQAGLAALQKRPLVALAGAVAVEQAAKDHDGDEPPVPMESDSASLSKPETHPVRPKRELILALLRRPKGASVSEMMAATSWLPHTTRAALTGLRHKGLLLERSTGEDGKAVYRIIEPAPHILETATQPATVA